jgi:hypothetical protein
VGSLAAVSQQLLSDSWLSCQQVGLVRGAGGLCMAAAAGAVLLLLLALLLLPQLSSAGERHASCRPECCTRRAAAVPS